MVVGGSIRMTELKTLKDLKENFNDFYIKRNLLLQKMRKEDWIVNVHNKAMISWAGLHTLEMIKAEAIKWYWNCGMYDDPNSVKDFILDFFNITEEDLK